MTIRKKLPEEFPDKWIEGYICAVCVMIKLQGQVQTECREMFRAGVGQLTLTALRKRGVDISDMETLEEHWHDLH